MFLHSSRLGLCASVAKWLKWQIHSSRNSIVVGLNPEADLAADSHVEYLGSQNKGWHEKLGASLNEGTSLVRTIEHTELITNQILHFSVYKTDRYLHYVV